MSYKEVRDEIMAYGERKRDLFGSQVKAMEVDRFEHNEWEKYAAEKGITWWRGDTVQRSWGDNHDVPGDVDPLHHKGNSKGHYFATRKGTTFSSGNCGKGRRARASTVASSPAKVVAKALAEKATARREVGKVEASSMELVPGVESGATRNLDVDGEVSTWSGSVELELNTCTTLRKRRRTLSKVPMWRFWR